MERFVSVHDGKFKAKLMEKGQGEPLLFLHGAGGSRDWPPFLELLSQEFHVYAPWHPGYDESEGIDYIDDMLDIVLYYYDFLDAIGVESTNVLGHSMGGMIAAEMAAICPHRVSRLVLASAAGLWLDEEPMPDLFAMMPNELMPAIWHDPTCEAAQQMIPPMDDPEAMALAFISRAQSLAVAGKFLWPLPDRGLSKRLDRIRAPTLILWGESDGLIPLAYGKALQRGIKNSRLDVMRECSHMLMAEKPEEFAEKVSAFLKG